MTPLGPSKPSLTAFLEALRTSGGLRLDYVINSHESAPEAPQPSRTEVVLSGPDVALLLDRNGELLHAIESLAAAVLRLEPEQIEQLSFDAEGFKAGRLAAIHRLAEEGIAAVKTTGKPFLFAPMNSRERRLLHLALVPSGLATASSGLGPRRFVVLYPAGQTPDPERFDQPARRPGPFRNSGGYRNPGPFRNGPPRLRPDPFRGPSAPQQGGSPEQDPENHGNQRDTASPAGEDRESTEARLDSIRRAFRKR